MKEKPEITYDAKTPIDPVTRVSWVVESLERLRQQYIDIDIDSVDLCIKLLRVYADKLEPRKDVTPAYPPEIDAVIMLLNKVSTDLDVIREIVIQDTGELDKTLSDK